MGRVNQVTPPFRRDEDDEGIINIIKEQKKEDLVFPCFLYSRNCFIYVIEIFDILTQDENCRNKLNCFLERQFTMNTAESMSGVPAVMAY